MKVFRACMCQRIKDLAKDKGHILNKGRSLPGNRFLCSFKTAVPLTLRDTFGRKKQNMLPPLVHVIHGFFTQEKGSFHIYIKNLHKRKNTSLNQLLWRKTFKILRQTLQYAEFGWMELTFWCQHPCTSLVEPVKANSSLRPGTQCSGLTNLNDFSILEA